MNNELVPSTLKIYFLYLKNFLITFIFKNIFILLNIEIHNEKKYAFKKNCMKVKKVNFFLEKYLSKLRKGLKLFIEMNGIKILFFIIKNII